MRQKFILHRAGGLEKIDFRALGFRCGLEIHHQILTEKKLFCRCPARKYSDEYHAEVLRHMRPTLSELGEYDGTALMEFKTKKEIIYRLHKDSVCTYEMDDTPPFPLNLQALDIAIEIALLLNCKIVDEVHIARKQYLDGSIPTGFQRTAIVGWDGWIPYKGRKIGIIQLALEEDACREVSDIGHRITFLTDRLSMPLIEVVTAPDMLDPLEAAEVGGLIGILLRLTGKVRRGYGAVRQDVNVSITGGTRVEIKGVPKLSLIPRLTGFEALRQKQLLKLKDEVMNRGFTRIEDFKTKIRDLTSLYSEFQYLPLTGKLPPGFKVQAVCFKGLKGIFAFKLFPQWSFANEVSGRVKVIACLDQLPNLAHTDPQDSLSLHKTDAARLKKIFKAQERDVIAITWGPSEDVDTAISEIIIRVQEILKGVINETRQRLSSGYSDFERILPGPDRMYPDTDSPPTAVSEVMITRISTRLPETPWCKMERLQKMGISPDIAWSLLHSPYLKPLENTLAQFPEQASVLAQLVLQYIPVEIKRNGNIKSPAEISDFLRVIAEKNLAREQAIELLRNKTTDKDWRQTLSLIKSTDCSDEKIDATISMVLGKYPHLKINYNAVIGEVRGIFNNAISGKRIYQRLRSLK